MLKKFSLIILLLLLACFSVVIAQQQAPLTQMWDLKDITQLGLFVFYDAPAGVSTTGKPLDIADFDGNGCGDLAITGQNASPLARGAAGHIRIAMNICFIGGQIAMDSANPDPRVFSIFGAYPGDMTGVEVYVADFNSDGFDDLLIGAQNNDGRGRQHPNAGAVYIVLGSADFASRSDVDLLEPDENIITLYGASDEDRLGIWVEGADFNGDGFDDALVAANQADGEGDHRINAGEVWIIYGAEDMVSTYSPVIDLSEPPVGATRIIGVDYDDLLGGCVWGDDLNGDGYADAIVSAALWRASSGLGGLSFGGGDGPANRRYNSGETFVVYGSSELPGQTIDLAALIDETGHPVDNSITVIYGPDPNDLLGEEIATGDINGDGRLDLILGTLIGDGVNNNQDEAGEAWIIYTDDTFEGRMIDLADPDTEQTVVIYPDQADSKGGDTIRAADLDQDGVDDLFYGAPNYDPTDSTGDLRPDAGMLAVIFGDKGGLPNNNGKIVLPNANPRLRVRYLIGADDNDMMAYAMAIYDVDGDGYVDIAPNAMGGDGAHNDQINAGEVYVISGAEFMSGEHTFDTASGTFATPTPWPTSTPLPAATVAPSGLADSKHGQQLYMEMCFACHGIQGEGVVNLGVALTTSPLVMYSPDDELLAFLREGRSADHPENTTGVSMPASGGRPDWTDKDMLDIIAYLRQLREYAARG